MHVLFELWRVWFGWVGGILIEANFQSAMLGWRLGWRAGCFPRVLDTPVPKALQQLWHVACPGPTIPTIPLHLVKTSVSFLLGESELWKTPEWFVCDRVSWKSCCCFLCSRFCRQPGSRILDIYQSSCYCHCYDYDDYDDYNNYDYDRREYRCYCLYSYCCHSGTNSSKCSSSSSSSSSSTATTTTTTTIRTTAQPFGLSFCCKFDLHLHARGGLSTRPG